MMTAKFGAAASTLVLMLAAAPAAAEEGRLASQGEEERADDIVVTAQKRSERLIDVPVSVAAVTAAQIEGTGAQRVTELANYVPNVAVLSNSPLNSTVYIRGVGSDSRNIGFDSRVGVYLDDVYLGQSPALDQELLALERVEVLRGPQGALFGKNTVAGAVNLITARPSDHFTAAATARVGNLDLRQFSARASGPIADGVAIGASASDIHRDGYIHNLFDGKTAANRNAFAWRAQLDVNRFGPFTLYATLDGLTSREHGNYGDAQTNTFATAPEATAPARDTINYNRLADDRRRIFGGSVELGYELPGGHALKAISSYRRTRFHTNFDVDRAPVDLLFVDYRDTYRQFTEELQFVSPGGERFDYLLGLYYYRQDASTQRDALGGAASVALGIVPGRGVLTGGALATDNIAAFGNASFDVTDRLTFGFGFRLSRETKKVDWAIDGSAAPAFQLATGAIDRSRTDEDFSPTATLSYALSPDANVYLRYAEGYKSGGYNLDFIAANIFPNGIDFDKEGVRNYEAGFKASLLDRRLSLNAAIFRADYRDYQVNQFQDLGGGRTAIIIANAAKVRSQGVEIEAALTPVEGLTLRGGLGFLDAEFRDFPDGGPGGANLAGNRLPYASKFQGSGAVDYESAIPGTALKASAALSYSHRSAYFTDVSNVSARAVGGTVLPWGHAPGRGLVDARLALGSDNGRWEVALWSRNLTAKRYVMHYIREFLGTLAEYRGEPQTFGLELKLQY